MSNRTHSDSGRLYRVLVADDHAMVRAGIRVMLSASDAWTQWMVEEAQTSEEAVARVLGEDFDLVLMDYRLPGKGGDAATRAIREGRSLVRVLGLSNYEDRTSVLRMLDAGANGYVVKNVGADMLVSAMRTVLAGKAYFRVRWRYS